MACFTSVGSRILGKKLICTALDFSKPARISTVGRHNAQRTEAFGDTQIPAFAIVDIHLVYRGSAGNLLQAEKGSVDSVKGEKLICEHEKHPFINFLDKLTKRAVFKGNPAVAVVDRELKYVT